MVSARTFFGAATRQAACLACALAGLAAVAPAQTTFGLRVSAVGTAQDGTLYRGTSQVTSSPAGIDCRAETVGGIASSGTCIANFAAGTTVTLTATPLFGGTFAGWTGACAGQGATCTVAMTADRETATETIAKTFTLTVVGTGNASGTISAFEFFGRPAIACAIQSGQATGACVAEYPAGQTARLGRDQSIFSIAQFTGWAGCPDPGAAMCQMVMDGPKTVTVGWIAFQVNIGSGGGTGTGTVTGETFRNTGPFACAITSAGTSGKCSEKWELEPSPPPITLTATPTGGSIFNGWSGACTGTGPCVIPFQRSVLDVRALFTAPRPASQVALALLGRLTIPADEQRELDQLGNHDGVFDLGDLLALLARTGERLSPSTMSALLASPTGAAPSAERRIP